MTEDRFARTVDAEATIKRLADAGFNLALVRTWYGGATIYPSAVVEAAGGPRQQAQFAGRDPLADLIQIGRRYGVRIGVWMEYGLAERITSPSIGPILTAHPEWRMVGRGGLDYVDHGNGNKSWWMDPAHPEVRTFMRDLFVEVAARYPDLAVVEYDRFRYPDLSFSYSPTSIAAYRAATGEGDPLAQTDTYAPWVRWRRGVVTRMAGEIYRAVKAANPRVTISAAVVPPYMIDSSQDKLQHWPTWADSGYVDALDPMFYGTTQNYEGWVIQGMNFVKGKIPLYPGAQVAGNRVLDLVAVARRQKAGGITFWYESDLAATDLAALAAGPFARRVLPEFDDRRADDADATTAFTGAWTAQTSGDRGSSRRLAAGAAGAAAWRVPLRHTGDYDLYMRWPAAADLAPTARVEVSGTGSVAEPLAFTLRPRDGTGDWVRVGTVRVGSGLRAAPPAIGVTLYGSADGAVVADGVRLVRVQPMRVEEVVVEDLRTLVVRTTYDVAAVRGESFGLCCGPNAGQIYSATRDPGNARIVRLTLDRDLTPGQSYTLSAGVTSVEGYATLPGETTSFVATPADATVVDDGDATFFVTGTWTTAASGGYTDDYRTAGAGASALWNGRTAEAGRYVLEAYMPPAAAANADAQTYQVGVTGGSVSVTVSTATAGWQSLGAYPFDANATLLVRLASASGGAGRLTADAVRWRRTIGLTTAADAPERSDAGALRLWPNPAADVLHVSAGTAGRDVRLEIVDALGRVVATHDVPGGVDAAVPVSHLAPGLYVAVVRTGEAGPALRRAFVRRP